MSAMNKTFTTIYKENKTKTDICRFVFGLKVNIAFQKFQKLIPSIWTSTVSDKKIKQTFYILKIVFEMNKTLHSFTVNMF